MKRDHVDRLCHAYVNNVCSPSTSSSTKKHIILCTHKRHSYESNELYIFLVCVSVCRYPYVCLSVSISISISICLRFVLHIFRSC